MKLFPNENLGPFLNEVTARGNFVYTNNPPGGNDGGENSGGDDNEVINSEDYWEETNLAPRDFSLILKDQITGNLITEITNGSIIDLNNIQFDAGLRLDIIIGEPLEGSIRVIIEYEGEIEVWKDLNFSEYKIDWIDWLLEKRGDFKVTMQAYSKKNAEGVFINEQIINFSLPEIEIVDLNTSGSASVSFTLQNLPVSFAVGSAQHGEIITQNYSVTSLSNSLPVTGFGLNNTFLYGVLVISLSATLSLISKKLDI